MAIQPGAIITRIGGALVMQYTTVQSAIERLTDETPTNDRQATVDLLDVSRSIAVAAVSGLDVDPGRVERLAGHIKGLVDEVWGIVEDAREEEQQDAMSRDVEMAEEHAEQDPRVVHTPVVDLVGNDAPAAARMATRRPARRGGSRSRSTSGTTTTSSTPQRRRHGATVALSGS